MFARGLAIITIGALLAALGGMPERAHAAPSTCGKGWGGIRPLTGSTRKTGTQGRDVSTPIERPDAEAMRDLTRILESGDSTEAAARKKVLEDYEVFRIDKGGMGVSFVARHKTTKEVVRFKAPLDTLLAPERARFVREAEVAEKIGELGLGPKAKWNEKTGMLEMQEIDGMTLSQFQKDVLSKMPAEEREAWMEKFALQLAQNVALLHAKGFIHLDLKPDNLMIPHATAKDGKFLFIDFGTTLEKGELDGVHRDLAGRPHPGSLVYQGASAKRGKPGFTDDYESVKVILDNLLPPTDAEPLGTKRSERTFLKERPALRAMLLLLEQTVDSEVKDPDSSKSTARLLATALKKSPGEKELGEFWTEFHRRLALRSAGQKLKILFADPDLHGNKDVMGHWKDADLKTLIDDGAKENGWQVDRPDRNSADPKGDERRARVFNLRASQPVDFEALKKRREALGPPSNPKPSGFPSLELD